jgi:hypothetical protein
MGGKRPVGVCVIDGCERRQVARGWCSGHYNRWRKYGNPTDGGTGQGERLRFVVERAVPFDGDECLIWPYARSSNGYGKVRRDGREMFAGRLICEMVYGPPPSHFHQAAHSCGRGHEGCVNPRHLRWATPKENNADKICHGTQQRGERAAMAKLTNEQAKEVLALKGLVNRKEAARRFGIHQETVSDLWAGRSWAWLAIPVPTGKEGR